MSFLRITVYDPDKVSKRVETPTLLSSASNDAVAQAYKLCSEKDMVPEMVYLLGKIGDNKKALKLIIERLDDVKGVSNLYHFPVPVLDTECMLVGDRICERTE